ncbi:MAG: helix-turn-helix domain-containing protein [Nitrosotalea sp.]
MQVLLLGRDVDQENIRHAMLKIISNEQAIQVLECSIDSPKSAYEISTTCSIPLTQVYRWVRKLHKMGLVRISGATNDAGKKYFMYKSKVKEIKIVLSSTFSPKIEIL